MYFPAKHCSQSFLMENQIFETDDGGFSQSAAKGIPLQLKQFFLVLRLVAIHRSIL
jgi:hypothetical protein